MGAVVPAWLVDALPANHPPQALAVSGFFRFILLFLFMCMCVCLREFLCTTVPDSLWDRSYRL